MDFRNNAPGYRGYIGSRPYSSGRVPQHVQGLVVRDYCDRMALPFLLSAVEFAMPHCYLTLEQLLEEELPYIDGIVMYSIYMLPEDKGKRLLTYERLLETNTSLHGALEQLSIGCRADIDHLEMTLLIEQATHLTPKEIPLT